MMDISEIFVGDVNIGHLVSVRSAINGICHTEVESCGTLLAEAFQYAIRQVNDDENLLQNITVGYVA